MTSSANCDTNTKTLANNLRHCATDCVAADVNCHGSIGPMSISNLSVRWRCSSLA